MSIPSVKFRPRKEKDYSTSRLYFFIRLHGVECSRISADIPILHPFDQKTQRFKGTGKEVQSLNQTLEIIRATILDIFNERSRQKLTTTANELKELFLKTWKPQEDVNPLMFLEVFESYIVELIKNNELENNTKKHYGYTVQYFKDFLLSEKKQNIELSLMSESFGERFMDYLKPLKIGTNYKALIFSRVSACLDYCVKKGYIQRNEFLSVFVKRDNSKNKIETLTHEQIEKLKNSSLTAKKETKQVLDCFLLQCYTGLDYGDLQKFSLNPKSYIKHEGDKPYIEIDRQKRKKYKKTQRMPLVHDAIEILERYAYKLPIFSNEKMNTNIKKIFKVAEIVQSKISTHVGRKTFATNMLNSGVDINTVSDMLAHSTISMTKDHYAVLRTKTILEEVERKMSS